MSLSKKDLDSLFQKHSKKYNLFVVDAFIFNKASKSILIQKRSLNRKILPGYWDPIGGHVEEDEAFFDALEREIKEESQMILTKIHSLVHFFEWKENNQGLILQFLCEASGTPILEKGKATEFRWIKEQDLELFNKEITADMKKSLKISFKKLSLF